MVDEYRKEMEEIKMIMAILERIETIESERPFHRFYLKEQYKNVLEELNILLFPVLSVKNLEKVCEICDGLIITGSTTDIHPKYYNEAPIEAGNYDMDEFELDKKAIETFSKAQKPILGICAGMQSINVYFGGSLHQHIHNHELAGKLHTIHIEEGSFLYEIYKKHADVNSFHHQSIKKVAPEFNVSAKAEDGTIEAIEKGNIIGIQWHPEKVNDLAFFRHFFDTFCR